jgi:hypothetical protein
VERRHLGADARGGAGAGGGPLRRGAAVALRAGAAGDRPAGAPPHLARAGGVERRGMQVEWRWIFLGLAISLVPVGTGVHLPLRHLAPFAGDPAAGAWGDDGGAADLWRRHARAGAALGRVVVRSPGDAVPLRDQRRAGAGDDLSGAGDRGPRPPRPRGRGRRPSRA